MKLTLACPLKDKVQVNFSCPRENKFRIYFVLILPNLTQIFCLSLAWGTHLRFLSYYSAQLKCYKNEHNMSINKQGPPLLSLVKLFCSLCCILFSNFETYLKSFDFSIPYFKLCQFELNAELLPNFRGTIKISSKQFSISQGKYDKFIFS
jgi:hypothetical protein